MSLARSRALGRQKISLLSWDPVAKGGPRQRARAQSLLRKRSSGHPARLWCGAPCGGAGAAGGGSPRGKGAGWWPCALALGQARREQRRERAMG